MELKIENLSKTYSNDVQALKNLLDSSHDYNVKRYAKAVSHSLDSFSENRTI